MPGKALKMWRKAVLCIVADASMICVVTCRIAKGRDVGGVEVVMLAMIRCKVEVLDLCN